MLIAIDATTSQLLLYKIGDRENKLSSKKFLLKLKEIYPTKVTGIISDFGRGKCFLGVVDEVFPGIPHQVCLVHYMRYV